jgi:hypothetical protein
VAKLKKTQLDEKQYIANGMIACTFLLGLVNDGHDKNTKMGAYLQQTTEITSTADGNDTIKKLKARGGRDQLLMFLTGPAGSGKSTAMKVAQQFCYEFCIAVGIMWSDKTYGPYTALNIERFQFGIDCLILSPCWSDLRVTLATLRIRTLVQVKRSQNRPNEEK